MNDFLIDFQRTVEQAFQRLRGMTEEQIVLSECPGEWSAKEILGHLIDSAANNHQRFVRAQFTDDLMFPGYDQEKWVQAQRYDQAPWQELIELWHAYNRHLLHVIACIPESVFREPRYPHSLDRIARLAVSADQPVTLEYLIRDYLDHMKEHLGQILAENR
jgi:hypothetical protein